MDTCINNKLPVKELYTCGRMPHKDKLLMQIYADMTGREIKVASSRQALALGSAVFGSLVAGSKLGGYDSIKEAVDHMASCEKMTYIPIPKNVELYNQLFNEYKKLHDYFVRGNNQVMDRLKRKL